VQPAPGQPVAVPGPETLEQAVWTARAAAHEARVDALVAAHAERSARGVKHPVEDFLFTYYSLRPARLRRWHPGAGVVLLGPAATERLAWREHVATEDGGVTLDLTAWCARRAGAVRQVHDLLAATASRPAHLSCFGLHEWAMVYRLGTHEARHAAWPLRLGAEGTDAVVDTHRIRCTHHDAFRFFTGAARPLNAVRPRREDQIALEQPGCLHATMDLYKWAYKLLPAVPSELVLQAFELARDVRSLDMRASPYDLRDLGYEPVRIETPEGRTAFVEEQRGFVVRGAALRAALLGRSEALLGRPEARLAPGDRPRSR
jgi:hypothetical protein